MSRNSYNAELGQTGCASRGWAMSNKNPLSSLYQRANTGRHIRQDARALVRCILWASFAAMLLVLVAPQTASAAELAVTGYHRVHKHVRSIANYDGCRTGWWQAYCDGMRRPYWATRCS